MSEQVINVSLAESSTAEEAANEALVDEGFVPGPPVTVQPPLWEVGATYAKGALVSEPNGQIYRGQDAANKGNKPSEDADFVHWAPVGIELVPLTNPGFAHAASFVSQRAYASSPPARSDRAASAAETVSPGPEQALR